MSKCAINAHEGDAEDNNRNERFPVPANSRMCMQFRLLSAVAAHPTL